MLAKILDLPALEKPQLYIYILKSESGLIKIGKTSNIKQRIKSLSGSNSKGDKIIDAYCSQPTYLYTLEKIMHEIYRANRITGTEWFKDLDFANVCQQLRDLMNSENYERLNELRRSVMTQKA